MSSLSTQNEGKMFSNQQLRKLIIPLIFEQALTITVGMADTMMISSVGEAAVSGVSLVDMLNNLIISVLAALATGGAVVTAQFLGARNQKEACKSAKQLLVTSTVITIIISIVIILFRVQVLSLLFGKIEQDVFQNAQIYLLLSAVSFPFLAIYNSCAALFRSMGNSKITFKVSCGMNIINILGNAICIYGLKMGVAGVAIPSLLSRIYAAAVLYALLRDPGLQIYFDKTPYHFDWTVVKKIFYIGIPSGIESGLFQLGRVLVVSIIASFGTIQIAANGVANSLDGMGCIVGQAMSLAMITVIGQCVGAGDMDQVRYYTKKLLLMNYLISAVVIGFILLTLPFSLKLYGLGAETTQLAFILVWIHNGFAIIMWPAAFVLPNMLRACNDVKFTMFVSIASMVVFRIGLSIILGIHLGYGAIGVWIAMVVDWICRITCFVIRYLKGYWKITAYR